MTRERYNLFLELKHELDAEITEAKDFLNIENCCKAVEYNENTVELEGWRDLARGGGVEFETGTIQTGFLIESEKKEAHAAQVEYWTRIVKYQQQQVQFKIDSDTENRRQEFEKLKKEFDGPAK